MNQTDLENGARKVEEKITELCGSRNKNLEKFEWNDGMGLDNRESQKLTSCIDGKKVSLLNIPTEQIEDYPGGVGIEILEAHIFALVDS